MNIFKRIGRRISFEMNKYFHPTMIGMYRRFDGVLLRKTRISNTTHIDTPEKLFIEDNVFIGHYNFIDASNEIYIDEGCQITNYVSVLTHSSHIAIRLYGRHYTEKKNHEGYIRDKVKVGAYSFIGPHSVIMPGTKIGKGSIVSAFSYVSGEFPDFAIIKGNPAMVVGDTRKIDESFLNQNPELKKYYDEWAK